MPDDLFPGLNFLSVRLSEGSFDRRQYLSFMQDSLPEDNAMNRIAPPDGYREDSRTDRILKA